MASASASPSRSRADYGDRAGTGGCSQPVDQPELLGDPERIRTSDPQLRRLLLYPTELRGRIDDAIAALVYFAQTSRPVWPAEPGPRETSCCRHRLATCSRCGPHRTGRRQPVRLGGHSNAFHASDRWTGPVPQTGRSLDLPMSRLVKMALMIPLCNWETDGDFFVSSFFVIAEESSLFPRVGNGKAISVIRGGPASCRT